MVKPSRRTVTSISSPIYSFLLDKVIERGTPGDELVTLRKALYLNQSLTYWIAWVRGLKYA